MYERVWYSSKAALENETYLRIAITKGNLRPASLFFLHFGFRKDTIFDHCRNERNEGIIYIFLNVYIELSRENDAYLNDRKISKTKSMKREGIMNWQQVKEKLQTQ